MNEIIKKEEIKIDDMIYVVRGVQVMLSSELFVTKCHNCFYDQIVTHYDIGNPISMFNIL